MSDSSTYHRAAKPKASLYEEITAHIVADLEAGISRGRGLGALVGAVRLSPCREMPPRAKPIRGSTS